MHYKDGITEAQVGDLVKGTVYNTPGIHVGVLVGITSGQDACNARVAIPLVRSAPSGLPLNALSIQDSTDYGRFFAIHREGGDAPTLLVGSRVDYTACSDLELVHRP